MLKISFNNNQPLRDVFKFLKKLLLNQNWVGQVSKNLKNRWSCITYSLESNPWRAMLDASPGSAKSEVGNTLCFSHLPRAPWFILNVNILKPRDFTQNPSNLSRARGGLCGGGLAAAVLAAAAIQAPTRCVAPGGACLLSAGSGSQKRRKCLYPPYGSSVTMGGMCIRDVRWELLIQKRRWFMGERGLCLD